MKPKVLHLVAEGVVSNTIKSSLEAEAERWERDRFNPAISASTGFCRPRTDAGIEIKPLYTPLDVERTGGNYLEDIGFPGQFPFTRGDRPEMYCNEPFVISAYSGFGEASRSNARLKALLEIGITQATFALDLPTQCGYDSDHIMAEGEVGQAGVPVATLADMEVLFDGIAIEKLRGLGTLSNSIGPIVLAMLAVLGERRGLNQSQYKVKLQNDPLTEYIARGTQILPCRPAAKLAVDCVTWCAGNAPNWLPMTPSSNHMNSGGAGSTRATAMALANVFYYIDRMLEMGHDIDDVAPLIAMKTDERHDFFVAVANLRALRRVWARILRDKYKATKHRSFALPITVYGHGQETLQEPLNNIVRIAFGTLAYAMGGATYVSCASYDEAVSLPSEEAVRVAIRTQQIIAHEHGFLDTIDPLGGSYVVETLTNQIEDQIMFALAEIDEAGGALAVIEGGLGRRWMAEGAVRRQRSVDSGERPWVTVNAWRQSSSREQPPFRIDPEGTRIQLERLRQTKEKRNAQRVNEALSRVDDACKSGANVVPSVIEAVRAYATVGEIADCWRNNFGEHTQSTEF